MSDNTKPIRISVILQPCLHCSHTLIQTQLLTNDSAHTILIILLSQYIINGAAELHPKFYAGPMKLRIVQ